MHGRDQLSSWEDMWNWDWNCFKKKTVEVSWNARKNNETFGRFKCLYQLHMLIDKRLDKVVSAINIRQVMWSHFMHQRAYRMNELESVFYFDSVLCVDQHTPTRLIYPAVVIARYNCHDDDACFSHDNDRRERISFSNFSTSLVQVVVVWFSIYSCEFIVHSCENENRAICTQWRKLVKIIRYSYDSYRNIRALFWGDCSHRLTCWSSHSFTALMSIGNILNTYRFLNWKKKSNENAFDWCSVIFSAFAQIC